VQGTNGIYSGSDNGIYLHGKSPQTDRNLYSYEDFEKSDYYKKYTPKLWNELDEKARNSGHGGGDFMVVHRLIEAARNNVEPDIDVYDSATWSVITALSGRSVREKSKPVDFPDFTKGAWKHRSMDNSIFVQ
jgi:hypothetical protein